MWHRCQGVKPRHSTEPRQALTSLDSPVYYLCTSMILEPEAKILEPEARSSSPRRDPRARGDGAREPAHERRARRALPAAGREGGGRCNCHSTSSKQGRLQAAGKGNVQPVVPRSLLPWGSGGGGGLDCGILSVFKILTPTPGAQDFTLRPENSPAACAENDETRLNGRGCTSCDRRTAVQRTSCAPGQRIDS